MSSKIQKQGQKQVHKQQYQNALPTIIQHQEILIRFSPIKLSTCKAYTKTGGKMSLWKVAFIYAAVMATILAII